MENIKKINANNNKIDFYRRYCVLRDTDSNFRSYFALEYSELTELIDICNRIDAEFEKGIMSYIRIGNYLRCIRDKKLYEHSASKDIFGFAKAYCGISKAYTSKLINIAERFYIVEADVIGIKIPLSDVVSTSKQKNIDMLEQSDERENEENFTIHSLDGFSVSKLAELLPLSDDMITLYVKDPRMTVAELRQLVANLNYSKADEEKKVTEQNERLDEEVKDIEAVYNPRKYYDFDYFKSKTKEQLLNIVMELQKTYVKNSGRTAKNESRKTD